MYHRIELCGVRIDGLTLMQALREVFCERKGCAWVVTPNAKMLDACRRDPSYAELLNGATLVLPDGAGVLLVAKRRGTPLRERVAGISFGEALIEEAGARGLRVFLLGGKEGVAQEAAERLQKRHPNLCICGTHHGYFQKRGEENDRVLALLQHCRPDVLLICFGFPVQEEWARENLSHLPSVRIAACLGGTLDVWAGKVRRAPCVLSRMGLEWAWRMLLQPRRLADLPALIRFVWMGR